MWWLQNKWPVIEERGNPIVWCTNKNATMVHFCHMIYESPGTRWLVGHRYPLVDTTSHVFKVAWDAVQHLIEMGWCMVLELEAMLGKSIGIVDSIGNYTSIAHIRQEDRIVMNKHVKKELPEEHSPFGPHQRGFWACGWGGGATDDALSFCSIVFLMGCPVKETFISLRNSFFV